MAITFTPVTPANAAFGPLGAAAWALGMQIGGMSSTSGALLYSTDATTLAQDGTNLLYTTASGPRLQVGSGSGTSAGWIFGYNGSSGNSGLWISGQTPTSSNGILVSTSVDTYLQSAGTGAIYLRPNAVLKVSINSAGGQGPSITAGTATTDLQALSATQTWNASGVAFTGIKFTITDTASAAGSLAMQILGGASGATSLLGLDKTGTLSLGGSLNLTLGGSTSVFGMYVSSAGGNTTWITANSGAYWGITSGGVFLSSSGDTGISRGGAGIIAVGTGSAGNTGGRVDLTTLNVVSGGSTTISTGVGSVKMSSVNNATNAAWIPIAYAGTTYYVPAWTTNSP